MVHQSYISFFTLGDARSLCGLISQTSPLGSTPNFDADVKKRPRVTLKCLSRVGTQGLHKCRCYLWYKGVHCFPIQCFESHVHPSPFPSRGIHCVPAQCNGNARKVNGNCVSVHINGMHDARSVNHASVTHQTKQPLTHHRIQVA